MGLTLATLEVEVEEEEAGVKVIEGTDENWIVGWEENAVGRETFEKVRGWDTKVGGWVTGGEEADRETGGSDRGWET